MIRNFLVAGAMLLCIESSVLSQIQVGDAASPITHYNGKVGLGLGATLPSYSLDVNGTARFGAYALIGTGVAAGYYQDNSNGAYRSLNVSGNTGYYFQSYNGAATPMFVGLQGTYAGRVGIGTTTPQQQLHVVGNLQLDMPVTYGINKSFLIFADGNDHVIQGQAWTGNDSNVKTRIRFTQLGLELQYPNEFNSFASPTSFTTGIFLSTGYHGSVKGNVGIGTISPLYKLDVAGDAHANSMAIGGSTIPDSYYKIATTTRSWWIGSGIASNDGKFVIYDQTLAKHRLAIDGAGNVGIGITTPSSLLHVNGGLATIDNVTIGNGKNTDGTLQFTNNGWGRIISRANLAFWANGNTANDDAPQMIMLANGNVGIGVQSPDQKLVVDGTIRAEEVKVEVITASQMNVDGDVVVNKIKVATNGQTADFVFEDGYDLKDLAEVDTYIKENKHLPNIPSATDMEANGVDVAEMNKLLLQKVEELTLYVIELENARSHDTVTRTELEQKVAQQQTSLEALTKAIVEIKALLGAK